MAYVLFYLAKFLVLLAAMGYQWTHGLPVPDFLPYVTFACLPLALVFGLLSRTR